MIYDIYLGGPWEQYALEDYKTQFKEAFPDKKLFDPETHPSQETGRWFRENYTAMFYSRGMVAMSCDLPMGGVAQEVGMYWMMHKRNIEPLENLVVIWPTVLKPEFGKEVAQHVGVIVPNARAAIRHFQNLYKL